MDEPHYCTGVNLFAYFRTAGRPVCAMAADFAARVQRAWGAAAPGMRARGMRRRLQPRR